MLGFFRVLKFPLWLISRLVGKRREKRKSELEEKQRKYVRNFAPTHYSWQKSIGRDKQKKKSKKKKTNNSTERF